MAVLAGVLLFFLIRGDDDGPLAGIGRMLFFYLCTMVVFALWQRSSGRTTRYTLTNRRLIITTKPFGIERQRGEYLHELTTPLKVTERNVDYIRFGDPGKESIPGSWQAARRSNRWHWAVSTISTMC